MTRTFAIRAAALYAPIAVAALLLIWRRPARRQATGALLAGAWNVSGLWFLNLLARRFGWWSFQAQGGLFFGMPVDLYLGWAILWGPLAALAFPRASIPTVAGFWALVDLLLMPLCSPVVQLGPSWLAGEAVGVLTCLVPAQLLARWTTQEKRLEG